MKQFITMVAAVLCADGVIILLTGQSMAGEDVSDRLSNGLGLIGIGLGAYTLYEAVRRLKKWLPEPMSAEDMEEFHRGGGL